MTTTEGHDMSDKPEPLTGFELDNIEGRWHRYRADPDYDRMESSVEDVPVLLAEVDRLRAQVAQYHRHADEHVAKFDRKHAALMDARAESKRLRAELDESEQNHEKWVRFVRPELDKLRDERNELRAELKAAKSTRFENNSVGDVAAHIQAETINDLRLN